MKARIVAAAAVLLFAAPLAAQDDDRDWDADEEYYDKQPTGGFFGASFIAARTEGEFRDYVNGGLGGQINFWTQSSVSGTYEDEEFASTTNFDDGSFSYGGGGGIYIPVGRGSSPASIDIGVTYHNNGVAEYLREGDIEDNPDGSITLYPVRSDTDLLTFHIGVSFGISR